MTEEYQDFPAWMNHPGMQQAVVDTENPRNSHGVRFPPIVVNNAAQQEEYEAKGYVRAAAPDPRTYEILTADPLAADHEPVEYPKWVGDKIVQNEAEEIAQLEAMEAAENVEIVAKRGKKGA